jgi:hypothetical protein
MISIKIEALEEAMDEAHRFLRRAVVWREVLAEGTYQSKEGAACKRASMDLTRALAEVRRPN